MVCNQCLQRMRLDPYFTPDDVAEELIEAATLRPRRILDPAAGDGALLRAAARRWPRSKNLALDIDLARARTLRKYTNWAVGRCDFTSHTSRRSSPLLRQLCGNVDLALLNPPYSARGAATWPAKFAGIDVRCGRALAFVLTGLSYLDDGGQLICLVPVSTTTSRRDARAWALVHKFAAVKEIARFPRGTFSHGTAKTVGLRISLGGQSDESRLQPAASELLERLTVQLRRGRLPVHEAGARSCDNDDAGKPRFIHTTDLGGGQLRQQAAARAADHSSARNFGPSVLLPRIGKPELDKVVLWEGGHAVLSDCIYALESRTSDMATHVHLRLIAGWALLESAYGGSCAPYLTIARLIECLDGVGIDATWDGAPEWLTLTP